VFWHGMGRRALRLNFGQCKARSEKMLALMLTGLILNFEVDNFSKKIENRKKMFLYLFLRLKKRFSRPCVEPNFDTIKKKTLKPSSFYLVL
jgi:hypothetical protein